MALTDTDGTQIIAAVIDQSALQVDPLLDNLDEDQLTAFQNALPFLDERLRRAIQRKHGIIAANS